MCRARRSTTCASLLRAPLLAPPAFHFLQHFAPQDQRPLFQVPRGGTPGLVTFPNDRGAPLPVLALTPSGLLPNQANSRPSRHLSSACPCIHQQSPVLVPRLLPTTDT